MSDVSETTRSDEKNTGTPPLFLLGGFILAATAGSAYFVMPDDSQQTTISSTLVIPIGPDRDGPTTETKETTTQTPVEPGVGPEDTDPSPEQIAPETAPSPVLQRSAKLNRELDRFANWSGKPQSGAVPKRRQVI